MPAPSKPKRTAAPPNSEVRGRAAAAMAELSGELESWLAEATLRMAQARGRWRTAPGRETSATLEACAHDLKGLAGSCGFPLVGRAAASLERLLQTDRAPAALVEAHVSALLALVREDARGPDHPLGARLTLALESATARLAPG